MKETTLTLEQIETIITGYPDAPYFIRQNIVIPNCSWGFLNHEADLLVLNKTKHLVEIEIKRTWSDFIADFKKSHTHDDPKLSRFYYAVPLSIGERVFHWLYEGTYKCKPGFIYYERSEVTAYTTWLGDQQLIRPMVLTPHMWRRYAERAKVQKTGSELMKHYFTHNPHGADSHNNRVVGRSVRWNGEEHQSCCVEEGILLGQVVGDIYIVRTFITYDMCTGHQQQEFEAKRKEILSGRDMYDKIIGFYL